MAHVPFMLIPLGSLRKFSRKLYWAGKAITSIMPSIKRDAETFLGINAEEYCAAALINSFLVSLFFSILMFVLSLLIARRPLSVSLFLALLILIGIFMLWSFILLRYPLVAAGKMAEEIEKNLVYALKDLLLQVSSGSSLFNSIVVISNSGYGELSKEFGIIARKINSGMPVEKALEIMSIETKSDYLKRTAWQIMNTMKAGASMKEALKTIVIELVNAQRTKISDYAKELNMWSLLYMLSAVALPTIGVVLLVILGGFAGFEITKNTFIAFLAIDIFLQIAIIGLIKSRRPLVNF